MKRPYLPLFTRDWLDDIALRRCSGLARGVLVDLMCLMHEAVPYGHLTDECGQPLTEKFVLSRIMLPPRTYRVAIAELIKEKRLCLTSEDILYCKRMVRDEDIRLRRAAGGNLGGNPALKVNQTTPEEVNHKGYREGYHTPSRVHSRAENETEVVVLSKKTSLLEDSEKLAAEVAPLIHARHPAIHRDCSVATVRSKLVTILKALPKSEREAAVWQINRNHEGWCASEQWTKDGGQYARGLENWLAPTKFRFNADPPARASPATGPSHLPDTPDPCAEAKAAKAAAEARGEVW